MNRSLMVSAAGHTAVVVLGYFGLPLIQEPIKPFDSAMVVEIVTVADTTNVPTQQQQPKPEPKKVEAPPPPPEPPKPVPPPTPVVAAPPPPPPPAPPEPKPPAPPQQVAALPPEPKPEPIPEPKAKPDPPPEPKPQPKVEAAPPKPEPKPQPKPVTPPPVEAKPEKKPKEADPFASVLKTVEDLKKSRPTETKPDPKAKPEPKQEPDTKAFEQQIAQALQSKSTKAFDPTQQMTMSEIDLVRRQVTDCWNPPAGAKDAQNLIITIEVQVNRDGTVRSADIKDTYRMGDPFYRAAAESARRALFNPKCTPLRLPPDRYEIWQSMIINFDPKEMFGT